MWKQLSRLAAYLKMFCAIVMSCIFMYHQTWEYLYWMCNSILSVHCQLWGYGTIGSIRLQLWWCWFFSNRLWAFEILPGSYCLYNNIVSPRRFIEVFFFLLDDKYNHTTSVFYSIELNIIGKSQPVCTSARWILMST